MLTVGKKAPSFTLPSSEGDDVSLAALAGKYVVLYFYPRDDTPGCTIEAQEFRDQLPALKKAGAVVLGVSRDSIASHCKFRDKYGLTFPLLSDKDNKVMDAYGAWGEKVLYGKKTTGVIRSTVLIDPEGKIARHWPTVKAKGHAEAVLAAIQEIKGGTPAKKDAPLAKAADRTAANAAAPEKAAAKKAAPAKKPAAKRA